MSPCLDKSLFFSFACGLSLLARSGCKHRPSTQDCLCRFGKGVGFIKVRTDSNKEYSDEGQRATGDLEKKMDELRSLEEQFQKQSKSLNKQAREK